MAAEDRYGEEGVPAEGQREPEELELHEEEEELFVLEELDEEDLAPPADPTPATTSLSTGPAGEEPAEAPEPDHVSGAAEEDGVLFEEEDAEELVLEELEEDGPGLDILDEPDAAGTPAPDAEDTLYGQEDLDSGMASEFGVDLPAFADTPGEEEPTAKELEILDEMESFDLEEAPAEGPGYAEGQELLELEEELEDLEILEFDGEEDDLESAGDMDESTPLGTDAIMFGGAGEESDRAEAEIDADLFDDLEEAGPEVDEDLFQDLEAPAVEESTEEWVVDEDPLGILEDPVAAESTGPDAGTLDDYAKTEIGAASEESPAAGPNEIFEGLVDGNRVDEDLFDDLEGDAPSEPEESQPGLVGDGVEPTPSTGEDVPADLAATLASLEAANTSGEGFESLELGLRDSEEEETVSSPMLVGPEAEGEEPELQSLSTPTLEGGPGEEPLPGATRFMGRQDNLFSYGEEEPVAAAPDEEMAAPEVEETIDLDDLGVRPLDEEPPAEELEEVDEVYQSDPEREGEPTFEELYGLGEPGEDPSRPADLGDSVMVNATMATTAYGVGERRPRGLAVWAARMAIAASLVGLVGAGAYFLPGLLGGQGGSTQVAHDDGSLTLFTRPEHTPVPPPSLVPDGKGKVELPPVKPEPGPKVAQATPPPVVPVKPPTRPVRPETQPVQPAPTEPPPVAPTPVQPIPAKPSPQAPPTTPKVATAKPVPPPKEPQPIEPTPAPRVATTRPAAPTPTGPAPVDPPPLTPKPAKPARVVAAPWDMSKVIRGTTVLAVLPNGNYFRGRVRKISPQRVKLDYKGGELTFMASEVRRLVPAGDKSATTLEQDPKRGQVVLKNRELIDGLIMLENDQHVVVKRGAARIIIPREQIARINRGLAMRFEIGDTPAAYEGLKLDKPLPQPKQVAKPAVPARVDIPSAAMDKLKRMLEQKKALAEPPKPQ